MADGDVLELGLSGDDKVVQTAKERFQRCRDWEMTSRARFVQDIKFANADPDNGWQWPNYLWNQRKDDPNGYKPRLTVNKVRQHNLQIKNDARQNKPGIKISPVGNEATFKAAQAWQGLVRDIERRSKATQAYDTATGFQVDGGIGYIRVVTDYVSDDTFDQEIFIRRVRDPLNIYMDPDANELDGSDARFAFYFEDMPRGEFLSMYPAMRDKVMNAPLGNGDGWIDQDHVRVAEYFYKEQKKDRLVLMEDPEKPGNRVIARWSKIPAAIRRAINPDTIIQSREILEDRISWCKIAADEVIEKADWPGRYIPIVPVVGEQVIVEGQLDRKGHTRNLKDAQRMYNFWTSSAVEQVALQTKTRWFIPVGATENLESYYATINSQNYPFIPYNALDSEGRALPPPVPIEPPVMAEAFIKGMVISNNELGMASGQREENFGERGQTLSGKAISARERQGDNATYHFIDGLAVAIRQVGVIILDLAPHIYDTEQIRQIVGEDGEEQTIRIDPSAPQAYAEQKGEEENSIIAIFNPTIGRYWVEADVGPSYATRRQEAWNAFVQIISQNNELIGVAGDLLFRYADFPGADQMAQRLRRLVKPEILGEGPDPALVAAQEQMKALQGLIAEMTEKLAEQELKLKDKSADERIDTFRAESDRLKQLGNAMGDLGEDTLRPIIEQTIRGMIDSGGISSLMKEVEDDDADSEEEPASSSSNEAQNNGPQLAPDGNYYLPDPQRPGKYLRVDNG